MSTTQPEPATSLRTGKKTDVGSVFVSNYPPFSAWRRENLPDALMALQQPPQSGVDFGLYLHIPFCRKRCKFCYFRVYTDKKADEIRGYLTALATEIERAVELPAIRDRLPRFVYFGGGTPSYISVDHLRELVQRVQHVLPWSAAEEITFECEPGTLTESKLEAIREIGVTRLSLGIENFDDQILSDNGRAHVSKEIYRCLPWIEALDFDQLNVDLIAGMMGETWASWRDTVARTVELGADSVTVYQMELPFNTRFSETLMQGSRDLALADWDTKRAWHDYAFQELAKAGYEISSAYTMVRDPDFSRFVYRDAVWHGCDLLGTGVSSFSHVNGVHLQNVDGWGEYLDRLRQQQLPLGRALITSERDRLVRELILQLKLGEIDRGYFLHKFGVEIADEFREPFRRLESRGMLAPANGAVRLTRKGLLRVDTLLPEFYDSHHVGGRYT
jgi:oxygen-independent coproporphyrinogen-3 oxidase